jgi:hypothetical protein
MKSFSYLVDKFQVSDQDHILIMAQILINYGNITNVTHPFDVASNQVTSLQKEYQFQRNKGIESNVLMTPMYWSKVDQN